MTAVSDNGPIGFLVQIDRVELLHSLYSQVIIPTAVLRELSHPATPANIRNWIATPTAWLEVKSPAKALDLQDSGLGEREAIQLAKEMSAPLLCDDRQAVARARREGLTVTGTLGVLQEAHARGLTRITDAIADLRTRTDFHFPNPQILADIVSQAEQMRRVRKQPPRP